MSHSISPLSTWVGYSGRVAAPPLAAWPLNARIPSAEALDGGSRWSISAWARTWHFARALRGKDPPRRSAGYGSFAGQIRATCCAVVVPSHGTAHHGLVEARRASTTPGTVHPLNSATKKSPPRFRGGLRLYLLGGGKRYRWRRLLYRDIWARFKFRHRRRCGVPFERCVLTQPCGPSSRSPWSRCWRRHAGSHRPG
jgi:hypothetical protein